MNRKLWNYEKVRKIINLINNSYTKHVKLISELFVFMNKYLCLKKLMDQWTKYYSLKSSMINV